MSHPIPNQPVLFCRNAECQTSYENIDDLGICDKCGTPNIALVWRTKADFGTVVAYTVEEAYDTLLKKLLANPVDFINSLSLEPQL